MAKTKNYYLIRRVKKNIREDLLEWIDGNTINAEDHATPWNVIDADKLRKFIDELLGSVKSPSPWRNRLGLWVFVKNRHLRLRYHPKTGPHEFSEFLKRVIMLFSEKGLYGDDFDTQFF
jgi:hypothetical protein